MSGVRMRADHCKCEHCEGSGYIDVVEVRKVDQGYGHKSKHAFKESYPCGHCDGLGYTFCYHTDTT